MKKGIISVLSLFGGAVAGAGVVRKLQGDKLGKAQELSNKHLALFVMMNQWVRVKQEGKTLSSYFEKNGYKRIAIYGMSYAGETLVEELKGTGVEVAYGIDMRADSLYLDVDIVSVNDILDEVDAIVVTAVTFFDEIEEKLAEKVSCPIVSLEDILYEV
ncbi:MAG: hypothetical protein HDR19_08540 [Lachnospiraceae bacterium]|nr:hypothetical protein [Lachnospiraceae bacterium]